MKTTSYNYTHFGFLTAEQSSMVYPGSSITPIADTSYTNSQVHKYVMSLTKHPKTGRNCISLVEKLEKFKGLIN